MYIAETSKPGIKDYVKISMLNKCYQITLSAQMQFNKLIMQKGMA